MKYFQCKLIKFIYVLALFFTVSNVHHASGKEPWVVVNRPGSFTVQIKCEFKNRDQSDQQDENQLEEIVLKKGILAEHKAGSDTYFVKNSGTINGLKKECKKAYLKKHPEYSIEEIPSVKLKADKARKAGYNAVQDAVQNSRTWYDLKIHVSSSAKCQREPHASHPLPRAQRGFFSTLLRTLGSFFGFNFPEKNAGEENAGNKKSVHFADASNSQELQDVRVIQNFFADLINFAVPEGPNHERPTLGKDFLELIRNKKEFFALVRNKKRFAKAFDSSSLNKHLSKEMRNEVLTKSIPKLSKLYSDLNWWFTNFVMNYWTSAKTLNEQVSQSLKPINDLMSGLKLGDRLTSQLMDKIGKKIPADMKDIVEDVIKTYFNEVPLKRKKKIITELIKVDPKFAAESDQGFSPQEVVALIINSGPVILKAFQQLGDEIDSPELKKVLAQVKSDVPPMSEDEFNRVISTTFDEKHPLEETLVFAKDRYGKVKAAAGASVGQVHFAKYKARGESEFRDTDVVVKIKREGLDEVFEKEDRAILNNVVANNQEKKPGLKNIVNGFLTSIEDELDFGREFDNLKKGALVYRTIGTPVDRKSPKKGKRLEDVELSTVDALGLIEPLNEDNKLSPEENRKKASFLLMSKADGKSLKKWVEENKEEYDNLNIDLESLNEKKRSLELDQRFLDRAKRKARADKKLTRRQLSQKLAQLDNQQLKLDAKLNKLNEERNKLNVKFEKNLAFHQERGKALDVLFSTWLENALNGNNDQVKGFFHGDLHDGNIFFDYHPKNSAKKKKITLIDFGNATTMSEDEQDNLKNLIGSIYFYVNWGATANRTIGRANLVVDIMKSLGQFEESDEAGGKQPKWADAREKLVELLEEKRNQTQKTGNEVGEILGTIFTKYVKDYNLPIAKSLVAFNRGYVFLAAQMTATRKAIENHPALPLKREQWWVKLQKEAKREEEVQQQQFNPLEFKPWEATFEETVQKDAEAHVYELIRKANTPKWFGGEDYLPGYAQVQEQLKKLDHQRLERQQTEMLKKKAAERKKQAPELEKLEEEATNGWFGLGLFGY